MNFTIIFLFWQFKKFSQEYKHQKQYIFFLFFYLFTQQLNKYQFIIQQVFIDLDIYIHIYLAQHKHKQGMIESNQATLKQALIKSNQQFGQIFDDILQEKEKSVDAMAYYVFKESGMKRQQLIALTRSLLQKMEESVSFAKWMMMPNFMSFWMKVTVISELSVIQKQIESILKAQTEWKEDSIVADFLRQIATKANVKSFTLNHTDQLAELIQKDTPDFNKLKTIIEKIKEEQQKQNQPNKIEYDDQNQRQQLEEMKQMLQNMKNSLLDECFQRNLIQAYQQKIYTQKIKRQKLEKDKSYYNQAKYEQFKKQIKECAEEVGMLSHQFSKALQKPIPKDSDHYDRIINLREIIHPVFIPELKLLIDKNNISRLKLKNKDIVVILGVSGAGKSTLAQVMLGYKLRQKVSTQQLSTLVPVGGLKPQHSEFVAKASTKSVTKYISTVQIDKEYTDGQVLFLVDTPGFFDTGGFLIQVSNSLSTIKALGQANSIRFILLVNQRNDETRAGFKKLAKIVSRLFKKYNKSSVIYFLNRYNDEQLRQLPIKTKQMVNQLTPAEKGDIKFQEVINHFNKIISQAKKLAAEKKITIRQAFKSSQCKQVFVLDPVKPDVNQLYKKLMNQELRLEKPKNFLENILSQDARAALTAQATNLETIVRTCTNNNKFETCISYLQQLSQLSQITEQCQDIAKASQKLKSIRTELSTKHNEKFKQFQKDLQIKILSLRVKQQTFKQAKQLQTQLQLAQQNFAKIPLLKSISVKKQVSQAIEATSNRLLEFFKKQPSKELFSTVVLFSKYFDVQLKQKFIGIVETQIGNHLNSVDNHIKQESYQDLSELLKLLCNLCNMASQILENRKIDLQSWKQKLSIKTSKRLQFFKNIVPQAIGSQLQPLSEQQIKYMAKTLDIFSKVKNSQFEQLQNIQGYYKQTRNRVIKLARRYINQIAKLRAQSSIAQNNVKNVAVAKQNAEKLIQAIKEVKEYTFHELESQRINLIGVISRNRQNISHQIDTLENINFTVIRRIYDSICVLKKIILLIPEDKRQQCITNIDMSQNRLQQTLEHELTQCKSGNFDFKNASRHTAKLIENYKMSNALFQNIKINENQSNLDKIQKICLQLEKQSKAGLMSILQSIENYAQKQLKEVQANPVMIITINQSVSKIKKFFDEVKHTKFNPTLINKDIKNCQAHFMKQMQKCFTQLEKKIMKSFQNLQKSIQKQDNRQVNRQIIFQIIGQKSAINRLKDKKQLIEIMEQKGINLQKIQRELYQHMISDIQLRIKNSFQEKKKDVSARYQLLQNFQPLGYLDSYLFEGQQKFGQIFKAIREDIQKNLEDYSNINLTDILKPNTKIQTQLVQKLYSHYSQMKNNKDFKKKQEQLMQRLKYIIRQKQQNLVRQIRFTINKCIGSSFQPLEQVLSSLDELTNTIKQLNIFMDQQHRNAIKIDEKKLKDINQCFIRIIEMLEDRIKKSIQRGNLGYKEAEEYIAKMENLEHLLINFSQEDLNQFLKKRRNQLIQKQESINQLKKSVSISQIYTELLLNKKQSRGKKFKGQINLINQKFRQDYEVLQPKVQEQVKSKVNRYIESRFKNSGNLKKQQLKALVESLNRQKQNLPLELREQTDKKIQQQQQRVLKQRQTRLATADRQYSYKNLPTLLQKQQAPYIIQLYQRKTQKYLSLKLSQIRQIKNTKQLKKHLSECFPKQPQFINNNFNNESIERAYGNFKEHCCSFLGEFIRSQHIENIILLVHCTPAQEQELEKNLKKIQIAVKQLLQLWKEIQNYQQLKFDFNAVKAVISEAIQKQTKQLSQLESVTLQIFIKQHKKYVKYLKLYCNIKHLVAQLETKRSILSEIPQKFKQFLTTTNKSIQKIESQSKNLIADYKAIKLLNENTRRNSRQQKRSYIGNIMGKQQLILNLEHLKFLNITLDCNYNYKEIVQNKRSDFKKQIEECIEKGYEEIVDGFKNMSKQFSNILSFVVQIVQLIEETKLVKFEENKLSAFKKTIQVQYDKNLKKIEDCSNKIIDGKKIRLNKQKQLNMKYQDQQDQQINKIQKTFSEKKIKIQDDYKLKKDHDQEAYKRVKSQIDQIQKQTKEKKQRIKEIYQKKIDAQLIGIQNDLKENVKNFCNCSTICYKAVMQIPYKRKHFKEQLDSRLQNGFKLFGKKIMSQVYQYLTKSGNSYCVMLTNDYQVFKKNLLIKWEASVKGMNINKILQQMKIANHRKQWIKELFNEYKGQLDSWTKQYQKNPTNKTKQNLLQQIKNQSNNMTKYYHQSGSDSLAKPEKLLALIFALWVIINSQIQDDVVQFSYQPHPAQVVCIFLLLSFKREDKQENRDIISKMAQVGTGEGKSVILAGLSCFLALSGFEVNCVCYSSYLSNRDKREFANLFDMLQISNRIKYGTFDNICESLLNQQTKQSKGLRQQIKKMLQNQQKQYFWSPIIQFFSFKFGSTSSKNQHNELANKKILLIDEFDVFFDPALFGAMYRPTSCLDSQEIKDLIKFVWSSYQRNNNIAYKQLIETQEFKKCAKKFPKIKNILKQQVKGMLIGCRQCDHNYIVKNNLIQYKNLDTITDKISYGYQTIYAYIKQYNNMVITLHSMESALKINLIIAQFSYAELPRYFKAIIGVTGTYSDIPRFQKSYLEQTYGVKQTFMIPSVYGSDPKSERRLCSTPTFIKSQKLWEEVAKQIRSVHETGRPVLVFFKSIGQLQSFFNCPQFSDLVPETNFLNQTHPQDDKDERIKKTCLRGRITLMTKAFGRGTDFKTVFDPTILQIGHGGLHVIQTFLSVQKSEQTQIKGRTARQGDPGTYSLKASAEDLQLIELKIPDKTPQTKIEKLIQSSRQLVSQKACKQITLQLNNANQLHEKSMSIYMDQKIKQKALIQFILKLNSFPTIAATVCRTVILIDGTCSMTTPIRQLNNLLSDVVEQIIKITSENKVRSSLLQIGVYRNYNVSFESLWEVTAFEMTAQNLIQFIKRMRPSGGLGNEAMEVGFYHINNLPEVDQVIIIGDAAANTPQQTIAARKCYRGQSYWAQQKKLPILSSEDELQKIIARNIPIHSFCISGQKYFKRISQLTKGQAQLFDVRALDATEKLSTFISHRILERTTSDQRVVARMKSMFKPKKMNC